MLIRGFKNSDIPALCSIWNEHYGEIPEAPTLDSFRFEVFGLAKPYFSHAQMLVAEKAGEVLGFLHFGPVSDSDGKAMDAKAWGVFALCVKSAEQDGEIAGELLEELNGLAVRHQIERCIFRPPLPNSAFYLGLGPADSLAGVTAPEVALCSWLARAGFAPKSPTCLWELDLATFQAPVDRMQIQIRRAAAINQQLDEPVLPWWQACVLGHTEPTKFQLVHRTERRVICHALFWTLAAELRQDAASTVWLWPTDGQPANDKGTGAVGEGEATPDHMTFLLAEALRQFQMERIQSIRTAAAADEDENNATLRRLGFRPIANGMVFKREYGSS